MAALWLIFGLLAIAAAIANLSTLFTGRSSEKFRFLSLSLTALTVCSFYSEAASWAERGDWGALQDVIPIVSHVLWVLVLASILINGITLLCKEKQS